MQDNLGPIARRIARQRAAETAAIGRPSVFAPGPIRTAADAAARGITLSPFTLAAIEHRLTAAETVR